MVQNEQSKLLFAKLGITDVDVVGDTRFDRIAPKSRKQQNSCLLWAFKQDYKVFVAGSSWPPDEDIFIRFFNERIRIGN